MLARHLAEHPETEVRVVQPPRGRPYDQAAAEWHAAERARLTTSGRPPAFVDGQIAAIARINELVLVTSNRSHFEGFGDLQVVDWRDEAAP